MCCGKAFWKGIVVFCLAFGISTLVSDTFAPKDSPLENVKAPVETSSEKKCVPVDKNLKYENLNQTNSKSKSKTDAKKLKNQSKSLKGNQLSDLNEKELRYVKYYNPVYYHERQFLLHVEKCYEF